MGDYATKRLQALNACEKVINGIEDGQITTSSALLLCKKIARLVNDVEGQEWLYNRRILEIGSSPWKKFL